MKIVFGLFRLLLISITFQSTYIFAAVEYKDVESAGYGINENEAIQDALIQALSQVKGTYIKADKIKAVQRSIKDNKESISKESASKVSSYTKGLISSFDLISTKKDPDRIYEVRIKAKIPFYDAGPQAGRLRLAILPFRINPEQQNAESEKFVISWSQDLEEALVQSRKFAILDRNYQQETKSELETYLEGHKFEEISRLGQRIGTDYIIIGTLMNFYGKNSDANFPEIKRNRISLRIIDVSTGQIKYARKVSSAKVSAQQILDAIYPIPVVSVKGGQITIGSGGDSLKVGDTFEMLALGKEIYDPYSKESLGFEESSIGIAKITRVNPKTSIAEMENKADVAKLPQNGKLILRPNLIKPTQNAGSLNPGDETDW